MEILRKYYGNINANAEDNIGLTFGETENIQRKWMDAEIIGGKLWTKHWILMSLTME